MKKESAESKNEGICPKEITIKVVGVSMCRHTFTKRVNLIVTIPRKNGRTEYGIECFGEREVVVHLGEDA